MKAIKRIICPVDVYDFQPEAAEYALTLASALGAKISVLYVVEPIPPRYVGEGISFPMVAEENAVKQNAEAKLAEIMPRFGASCDEGTVVIGHADGAIIDFVEKKAGDLIIMASHCRTLVRRALFGSVTAKVLANAKPPVLVVYPDEK